MVLVLVVVLVLDKAGQSSIVVSEYWGPEFLPSPSKLSFRPQRPEVEDENDDEYEDDSKCLPNIPDLLQGSSTLI
jgi:hypothetical protein